MSVERLAELETQLRQARAVAETAAARANHSHAPADYQAAMETAAEVDRIWQQYSALWRKLYPPSA